MQILVVHESFFGNTAALAEAVATGARSAGSTAADAVVISPVAPAPPALGGIDVLVVGGPTHLLTLSSPPSRWLQAQYWGDPIAPVRAHRPYGRPSRHTPLRDWLAALPPGPRAPVAVFDTRMGGRAVGGAGPVIARRLVGRGYRLLLPPESFQVSGIRGPLAAGETQRALAWGRSVTGVARRLLDEAAG